MQWKIEAEIMIKNQKINFNDIIGMQERKKNLYEIIMVPNWDWMQLYFFNISSFSLTLKLVGGSEKTVRSLFKVAYKKSS